MTVNPSRLVKKEYLKSYKELKVKLIWETERAGYWEERAYSIPSRNPDPTGVVRSSMSNFQPIDKFLENADYCSELADKLMGFESEIESAIDKVPDPYCRMVLQLRYLNDRSFLQIARELGYSKSHVSHLHLRGLDMFEIPKHSNFWQVEPC